MCAVSSVEATAERLAHILTAAGGVVSDPTATDLEFVAEVEPRPLAPLPEPERCWAVDGGQAVVADARCLQVVATRAARLLWAGGKCLREDQGELRAHLLAGPGGGEEGRRAAAVLGAPIAGGAPVDLNLLRDWSEWELVRRCVEEEGPGGMVLVDGDLEPDWRVPASWLADLCQLAEARGVTLVGVTKHSSLARGGSPLVGQLELQAEVALGPRQRWWAPVAVRRPEIGPGFLAVVARLDPDAAFAFRVDLTTTAGPATVLGQLCSLSDDAAFPGYPYPLALADRLAACPGWARQELWEELDNALAMAGVTAEVRQRAFADRHSFMERT